MMRLEWVQLLDCADELEGIQREKNFFLAVRGFYMECMCKIIRKFPFTDRVISDLGILNPQKLYRVSSASITRLLNRFCKQCSTDEMDTILKQWHEYQSLPDDQLPKYSSLEEFRASMGQLPLGGGDEDAKHFGDLANMCKLLLILPHSTADPERLFSVIGKVDTSQRSTSINSLQYCVS